MVRYYVIIAFMFLVIFDAKLYAQSASNQNVSAGGSISGRITSEGKPMVGASVLLMKRTIYGACDIVSTATTTADGQYQFNDIAAGNYVVSAYAPALVFSTTDINAILQKTLIVADGETISGIDIDLKKGGVISGRVTDQEGNPVIEEQVSVVVAENQGRTGYPIGCGNCHNVFTDDRGIYRLFGLPEGNYLVKVGDPYVRGKIAGRRNGNLTATFYPSTADQSQAKPIKVTASAEISDIDVVVLRYSKVFSILGKVLDAETEADSWSVPGVWSVGLAQ